MPRMPKRIKFRKQMRGRMKGKATTLLSVSMVYNRLERIGFLHGKLRLDVLLRSTTFAVKERSSLEFSTPSRDQRSHLKHEWVKVKQIQITGQHESSPAQSSLK